MVRFHQRPLMAEINIVDDKLQIKDKVLPLEYLGDEPSEPGYDYRVEPYGITGELGKTIDAAKITIGPDGWTPPQRIMKNKRGRILDFPVEGDGIIILLEPDSDSVQQIPFDSSKSNVKNPVAISYEGCFICLKAGSHGMKVVEIQTPPFKSGDGKALDIDSDEVPEIFKQAYLKLVSNSK